MPRAAARLPVRMSLCLAALGYMRQTPSDDRHLITQTELESRVCVMLGGIILPVGAAPLVARPVASGRPQGAPLQGRPI